MGIDHAIVQAVVTAATYINDYFGRGENNVMKVLKRIMQKTKQ